MGVSAWLARTNKCERSGRRLPPCSKLTRRPDAGAAMLSKPRYPVGTRVQDRATGERIVVRIFRDLMLADVVVVRWGANNEGVTVPVSSLKKYRPPPIAECRRGRR